MFDDLLKQAGLRKKTLADLLGLTPETISKWQGDPPRYATAYLELYIEHKEAAATREQVREWLL